MKKITVLLVVLMIVSVATLAGCKGTSAVEPGTSEPVVSSEEVSEEASSEIVSEIVDGVQTANFNTYDELKDFANSIGDTVIISYSFFNTASEDNGQAILYDDGYNEYNTLPPYKIPENHLLSIVSQKEILYVDTNASGVEIDPIPLSDHEKEWFISVPGKVAFFKIPITIKYVDDTSERFTIYVTKEWSSLPFFENSSNEEAACDYSAEAVMKLVDDLSNRYQYNNPEHIKALVIAANLEYISDGDLETILNTYGYTLEDLATLYDECIMESQNVHSETFHYWNGNLDELPPEKAYENRIALNSVFINPVEADFAKHYDLLLINRSFAEGTSYDQIGELNKFVTNATSKFTNYENIVYGYTKGTLGQTDIYQEKFVNPFAD